MNEHEAQRFLNEQRYQAELPFPVSAVFTHYARSSSKNYALRSLQLVAAAQSTIRYAAIAAACDYATSPDPDETLLNWLRQEWLGGKKPSFGTWYGSIMRLLTESGKTWKHPFVPEFEAIDRELLEKKIQPLIHSRNVEIGHAEYYEALALKHFVELQEENLYAVLDQFSFLSRYPLAFAEVEEDYTSPSQGTKQAVNICRGASHNFARYTIIPSHPIPPGIPFIWNPEYTSILTLSPFLIFGRATISAEQREQMKGVAHIQGLMVLNGVSKGEPIYTSVDAEAQFSLEAFEFPPKNDIQEQMESTLKKGVDVPTRNEARLSSEEQDLLVRTTDYVEPVYDKESAPAVKRKTHLKAIMITAILSVMIIMIGFAFYARFTAPKQQIKSIAVLAFKDNSPTKDQEYLGEGIANAIIDKLNTLDGLLVIAGTSSFIYKGKEKSIKDIGEELNVGYVLEGNVLFAENRLQGSTRLIRVWDQSTAFVNEIDQDFSDINKILEDISTNVARELKGELNLKEKDALAKHPTSNPEAWELFMKGVKYHHRGGSENHELAINLYQAAIDLDSLFADAYVYIAAAYMGLGQINDSKKYIEKVFNINQELPDAYALLGQIAFRFEWNFPLAENYYKKALSIYPVASSFSFYYNYAMFLRAMTRYDEATRIIEEGLQHDPNNLGILGQGMAIYIDLKKYDRVMELYRKAQKINPEAVYPLKHLGRFHYITGKYKDALKIFKEMGKISRIDSLDNENIGITYGFMGNREKAERYVKNFEKTKQYSSIAYIYSALGDKDRAFEYLEKANQNREPRNWGIVMLKADPEYKKIRSDPRYKDMLKKIGLPTD